MTPNYLIISNYFSTPSTPLTPPRCEEPKTQAIDFDALLETRYLTKEQRAAISSHEISAQKISQYVEKLNEENGLTEIANDLENYQLYPIAALHAYCQKKITREQFATQCIFYAAIDQMIAHPTRYEVRFNPDASRYDNYRIESQSIPPSKMQTYHLKDFDPLGIRYLKEFFHASDEGIILLLDRFNQIPDTEKYFLTFELPIGSTSQVSPLLRRLNTVTKIFSPANVFYRCESPFGLEEQPQLLVVPSFTMMQTFLKTSFPESEMEIFPVLGKLGTRAITENKLPDFNTS